MIVRPRKQDTEMRKCSSLNVMPVRVRSDGRLRLAVILPKPKSPLIRVTTSCQEQFKPLCDSVQCDSQSFSASKELATRKTLCFHAWSILVQREVEEQSPIRKSVSFPERRPPTNCSNMDVVMPHNGQ